MSFGENLQYYRKKESITQEQMAERMEVSRQTISKWEAGNSYPEMDKLLQLCDMFSCSMDTLMRGDAQAEQVEDSSKYNEHMDQFRHLIVSGVFLLLAGFAINILLSSMTGMLKKLEDFSMFPFLIVSISIFVVSGIRHSDFVQKHPYVVPFYTEEKIEACKRSFPMKIAGGIVLLLLGVMVSMLGDVLPGPMGMDAEAFFNSLFFMMAAVGVAILVAAGMQKSKYNIEEYNKSNYKLRDGLTAEEIELLERTNQISPEGKWCAAIMMLATAVYLIWSFGFGAWDRSWLVFPVAGIFCGIAAVLVKKQE